MHEKPLLRLDWIFSHWIDICQEGLLSSQLTRLKLFSIEFNVQEFDKTEINDIEYDISTFLNLQKMNSLPNYFKNLKIMNAHHITFTEYGFIIRPEQSANYIELRKNIVDYLEKSVNSSTNLNLQTHGSQRS